MNPLFIGFAIWKIIDIITSFFAPLFIPYLGFFSYGKDMLQYNLPLFIRSLSNFDGIFYIRIAMNGYSQTEQAFFPVYPLLIRYLNPLFNNPIVTGVVISNVAFVIALYVFYLYLKTEYGKNTHTTIWILLFLLTYPLSFFFGVMYTESVFLLFFISTLYCYKKQYYLYAFVFAYLTGLTRVIGVFLAVPLFLMVIGEVAKYKKWNLRNIIIKNHVQLLVCAAPVFGIATYCYYLWQTTGDPLYFFHAQESFGANRSAHLISPLQVGYRYVKIFLTADHNVQYYVAILESCFYLFAGFLLSYDLKRLLENQNKINFSRLGLNIFSWINLVLPSLTGTLTAVPRYSMLSLSLFFVLGEIENRTLKIALLIAFALLHVILFAFWVQGYYVT